MKHYDPDWNAINTLLSFLRSSNVVALVRAQYTKFNNDAPSQLLEIQIEKVQKILDKAG